MALPIGQVPNTKIRDNPVEDAIWHRFFENILKRITLSGQIDHNKLDNLQGGSSTERYHLTSSQHTTLTAAKSANTVYAGPISGASAVPSFRALTGGDLPSGAKPLQIVYTNETLTIPDNIQVTGHSNITFSGTGGLVIDGTGSLAIL